MRASLEVEALGVLGSLAGLKWIESIQIYSLYITFGLVWPRQDPDVEV